MFRVVAAVLLVGGVAWAQPGGGGFGQQFTAFDEGVALPFSRGVNFEGAGVTCVHNSALNASTCTIPGGGGAGSSIILDLGDDGANESAGITEFATTGDVNNIVTEPTADKVLLNMGAAWPVADAATIAITAGALALDPTDCPAGEYADAIGPGGDLTCDPVNFTELAGEATVAQLPDTFDACSDCSSVFAATSFATMDTPSGTDPVADSTADTLAFAASGIVTITGDSGTDTITIGATEIDGSTTNEIQNLFETVATPSGTSPVADTSTDTLTLAASGIVTITGTAGTDTITIGATEVDGSTTNELQNLFATIDTSSGTDPVADANADTLVLSGTSPVVVTGDSGTDTVTISLTDVALGSGTSGDYVASFTAGTGLTGNASGEGSTPTINAVAANASLLMNADNMQVQLQTATDALSATTSSGSGLEVTTGGLTLLQGCSDGQQMTWVESTDTWDCGAAGGGGGGNSFATVGAATADSSADTMTITDSLSIDLTTTNDPEDLSAAFRYDQTQAGNPALGAEQCIFTTDGTGGGILCEGSIADTNEGLLAWAPTADRVLTLPDETGTVCSTGAVCTGYQAGPLSGDVVTSGAAATIQPNSVALGADTTGDYFSDVTANQGLLKAGTEGASVGLQDCAAGEVLRRNSADTQWECRTQDEIDVTTLGAVCDGTTDDTTGLNTIAGTANRGLVIPSGKFCLVSGPVTLASGVTVRGTSSSGFVVSTKVCVGGSLAGASCDSNTQCAGGGTCTGTAFAPTAGTGYPILQAASGSLFNAVDRVMFKAVGIDGYNSCVGGSNAGQPCISTCAGGANSGKLCTVNGDCPSSTCTLDTGANCTGGGTCNGATGYPSGKMTPGSTPSSGNIRAIDFANAASSSVRRNTFVDLRQTDTVIRVGADAYVTDNQWMEYSSATYTYNGRSYVNPPRGVAAARETTYGATQLGAITVTGDRGFVAQNNLRNWNTGVAISLPGQYAQAMFNTISAASVVANSMGIVGPGTFGRAFGNILSTMDFAFDTSAVDVWLTNNTMSLVGFSNFACSSRLSGSGVHFENNDVLWSLPACLGGASAPSAVDNLHVSVKNNFAASGFGPAILLHYDDPGKRCSGGTQPGKACTTSGDCAGSGTCRYTLTANFTFANNDSLGKLVDFSEMQFPSASTTGAGQFYQSFVTENRCIAGVAQDCMVFPASPLRCDGGANLDATCTPASCSSDCGAGATCPDDCVSVLQTVQVAGNKVAPGMTTAYKNWTTSYGSLDGIRLAIPAASCQGGTAASNWDAASTEKPDAACITGTNIIKGVLDFEDGTSSTAEAAQITLMMPDEYLILEGMVVSFQWQAASTSNAVRWCAQAVCQGVDDAADPAFDTAVCINSTAMGTANDENLASVTLSGTSFDTCQAEEQLHLKIYRDADNGGDTMSGDARLTQVGLRWAR